MFELTTRHHKKATMFPLPLLSTMNSTRVHSPYKHLFASYFLAFSVTSTTAPQRKYISTSDPLRYRIFGSLTWHSYTKISQVPQCAPILILIPKSEWTRTTTWTSKLPWINQKEKDSARNEQLLHYLEKGKVTSQGRPRLVVGEMAFHARCATNFDRTAWCLMLPVMLDFSASVLGFKNIVS